MNNRILAAFRNLLQNALIFYLKNTENTALMSMNLGKPSSGHHFNKKKLFKPVQEFLRKIRRGFEKRGFKINTFKVRRYLPLRIKNPIQFKCSFFKTSLDNKQ